MGLLKRPATHDDMLVYEGRRTAPDDGPTTKIVATDDGGDALSAARGTVLGVVLGALIWAVVLWALL